MWQWESRTAFAQVGRDPVTPSPTPSSFKGPQTRIQDFGQGASGVLTPRGALSPKFAQNRGFALKIAWKLHDFGKILGARGTGPPAPWICQKTTYEGQINIWCCRPGWKTLKVGGGVVQIWTVAKKGNIFTWATNGNPRRVLQLLGCRSLFPDETSSSELNRLRFRCSCRFGSWSATREERFLSGSPGVRIFVDGCPDSKSRHILGGRPFSQFEPHPQGYIYMYLHFRDTGHCSGPRPETKSLGRGPNSKWCLDMPPFRRCIYQDRILIWGCPTRCLVRCGHRTPSIPGDFCSGVGVRRSVWVGRHNCQKVTWVSCAVRTEKTGSPYRAKLLHDSLTAWPSYQILNKAVHM